MGSWMDILKLTVAFGALQMHLITLNRAVPVTDELQQMLILITAKTCYGHKLQE